MATNPKLQAPWGEYVPHLGRMVVEQFEQFPGENGSLDELHMGRLIVMPGPGIEHAIIQSSIYRLLDGYLQRNQLGLLLGTSCYNLPLPGNSEELLCPDLSYIEPKRLAGMPRRGSYPVGAPNLVIEIASSSDTHPELAEKIGICLQAGVRLVWAIWPGTRTIDVWRPNAPDRPIAALRESDILDGFDVIPGFQCTVPDCFALA
jgi:Uma2 family endonuclease